MTERRTPERPYRPRDPQVTSRIMSKVRSKDSKPELLLRRTLWHRGRRYRLHSKDLPGRPDIVFRSAKVVIFVDSDWWHGRILREKGEYELRKHLRGSRQDWWVGKLSRNVERDAEVTAALEELGWTVIRLWTSEIREDPEGAADQVEAALDAGEWVIRGGVIHS